MENLKENKEFREMIEKGKGNYNIIYLCENGKDSYCLLNKNDKFYYIQYNTICYDIALLDYTFTITLYNKKGANEKQQADYSKGVNNLNDILNYIAITKNEKFKDLKETHPQKIFYQLSIIEDGKTIMQHLKDNLGYREQYILKNLDRIEETQNDNNYHILKFIDTNENYFKINTKDYKRLIVG